MTRIEKIEQLLDGIQRSDGDNCWWETSTGEEFGIKVLAEIRALFPLRSWVIEFVGPDGNRRTAPLQANEIVKVNDRQLEIDGNPFTLEQIGGDATAIGDVRLAARQPHPDYEKTLASIQAETPCMELLMREPIPFSESEMKGWMRRY